MAAGNDGFCPCDLQEGSPVAVGVDDGVVTLLHTVCRMPVSLETVGVYASVRTVVLRLEHDADENPVLVAAIE